MAIRIKYERANGSQGTVVAPSDVAWRIGRSLAADVSNGAVHMIGKFGTAQLRCTGDGSVAWGLSSTCPGKRTTFNASTVVCID